MTSTHTITHASPQTVIVSQLKLANNFLTRLKGLIGAAPLSAQQGILISPCQQVHTHFMGFSIDVVFLDKQLKVLHIIHNMPPWRFSKFIKSAYYVLELPANGAMNLHIDDTLQLNKNA